MYVMRRQVINEIMNFSIILNAILLCYTFPMYLKYTVRYVMTSLMAYRDVRELNQNFAIYRFMLLPGILYSMAATDDRELRAQ